MIKDNIISVNDGIFKFTGVVKLSDNIEKTAEGYLKCFNVIMGRSGFQKYLGRELTGMGFKDNEVVEVWRDESEVFREETLDSGEGKPVTENHPIVDVTVNNIKELGKGTILTKLWRNGDNMEGNIIITDKRLADKVEKKELRELSLGYSTRLIREGNMVKQTNILINHLAILKSGRAGNAMIKDNEIENNESRENMDLLEMINKLKDNGFTVTLDNKENKSSDKEAEEKEAADKLAKDQEAKEKKEAEDKKAKDEKEAEEKEQKEKDAKKEKDEEEGKNAKKGDKVMDRNEILSMLKDGLITSVEAKELLTEKVTDGVATQDALYGKNQATDIKGALNTKQRDTSIVKGDEFIKHLQKMHDENFGHDHLMRKYTTHDEVKHAIEVGKSRKSNEFIGGK